MNIEQIIRIYEPEKTLNIFEGIRNTLPASAFPSLEIEATNCANQWATTRSQRPRFQFQFTLTVINSNDEMGSEYVCSLATVIGAILTDPTSLHLQIENEVKFDPNDGLVVSFIIDSFTDDITYNASKDGSIRVAEFSHWVQVHEPFADSKWLGGDPSQTVVERTPKTITLA